jgi:uncharacterized protein
MAATLQQPTTHKSQTNTCPMELTIFLGLSPFEWIIGIAAAASVGLGKGGLPGMGNLAIVLIAMIFPSKTSVGVLLPVLIMADMVAVKIYHAHAEWKHLLRLLPWTLAGIALGAWVFVTIDNQLLTRMIGGILLVMILLHQCKRWFPAAADDNGKPNRSGLRTTIWIGGTGILGGIATMVANAAGPVVTLYLLLAGLPKYALIGTSAWFFFLINLTKLPVQIGIGNINSDTLPVSLTLGLFAMAFATLAPRIVKHIPQRTFSILVWIFVAFAGVKMLLS